MLAELKDPGFDKPEGSSSRSRRISSMIPKPKWDESQLCTNLRQLSILSGNNGRLGIEITPERADPLQKDGHRQQTFRVTVYDYFQNSKGDYEKQNVRSSLMLGTDLGKFFTSKATSSKDSSHTPDYSPSYARSNILSELQRANPSDKLALGIFLTAKDAIALSRFGTPSDSDRTAMMRKSDTNDSFDDINGHVEFTFVSKNSAKTVTYVALQIPVPLFNQKKKKDDAAEAVAKN